MIVKLNFSIEKTTPHISYKVSETVCDLDEDWPLPSTAFSPMTIKEIKSTLIGHAKKKMMKALNLYDWNIEVDSIDFLED